MTESLSSLRASAWIVLTALLFAVFAPARAQDVDKIVELLKRPPEAPGAESAAREAAEETTAAPAPLLHLRDRSQVAGTPALDALAVETRYGQLRIPYEQLVRVRFARRVDSAVLDRVKGLIAQLGADDFDVREEAMDALREVGPRALGPLREAAESDDEELQNRATVLVGELEGQVREEQGDDDTPMLQGSDDEIVTDRMTLRGKVSLDSIEVDSRYGRLAIHVADLVAIHFKPSGGADRRVAVDASNQPPSSWLDTKIDVEKGQRIRIKASGSTSVSDWGITSGPAGNTRYSGNTFGGFPNLSLVGRIGKNGKPFLVGDDFKEKSRSSGRLYLGIVPFQYAPAGATGKYQTKIEVGAVR